MSIAALVAVAPLRRGARDLFAPDNTNGPVWLVQKALNAAGHELVLDGDYGRNTEAAVIRYKAAHGYAATGYVGPLTGALLDAELAKHPDVTPLPSVLATAPWLSVNRAITGTKEFPGGADNPIIFAWRDYIIERFPDLRPGLKGYTHDSIPWCGLGQAYPVAKAGYKPPLEPLYATNWFYAWKDGVDLGGPAPGAIAVMTRDGGGHVTEYEGEDDDSWFGRGSNQSDQVNVARFPKSRKVLGWMWPKNAPRPTTGRVRMTFNAAVSVHEA